MKISIKARNALLLGGLCSISYLAVYIARGVLGAVTPQMLADASAGIDEQYIGRISSVYFICYAVGQLINGYIGDKIKAKYMISAGLFLAGGAGLIFINTTATPAVALCAYAVTGFFLSMIYGPMTRVVAESTELFYATRCSLGYTFASFFGSPVAGILAMFFSWRTTFALSSGALFFMAVVCFVLFALFERHGIVRYPPKGRDRAQKGEEGEESGGVRALLANGIVRYSLVSIVTGVIRTSVVFWLPTYFVQYLGYGEERAAGLYTIITLGISFAAFVAVIVYDLLKKRMDHTVFLFFVASALAFVCLCFVHNSVLNAILIGLAILSADSAASVMWSIYCPGLSRTGMVSGATGFLDFLSYMAAAGANMLFANAAKQIGWSNLILVWAALMLLGALIFLPRIFKKSKKA